MGAAEKHRSGVPFGRSHEEFLDSKEFALQEDLN
jgi:hypothetical protein